jgi:hypothetical protein
VLACLEWVAHSVEIGQCRQPGWKGVTVAARLPNTEVQLFRGEKLVDRGVGENVLGSPLLARGETWTTQIRGLPLHGLKVSFA